MKNRLDKELIIQTATEIADNVGLENLTVKLLADHLDVVSPAIYKHFKGGLQEIKRELSFYAWKLLEEKIIRSSVGKSRDEAIRIFCNTYRDFAFRHKGLFRATHWYNSYNSKEEAEATKGIIAALYQVLDGYQLDDGQKLHVLRILRAFVQGYADIEINGGFGDPIATSESFEFAIDTILKGIEDFVQKNVANKHLVCED